MSKDVKLVFDGDEEAAMFLADELISIINDCASEHPIRITDILYAMGYWRRAIIPALDKKLDELGEKTYTDKMIRRMIDATLDFKNNAKTSLNSLWYETVFRYLSMGFQITHIMGPKPTVFNTGGRPV